MINKFKMNYGFDSIQIGINIIIVGGSPDIDSYSNDWYSYNIKNKSIKWISKINYARRDHSLAYLNSQIYWIGGRDKFGVIKKIEKMKGTTTF